MFDNTSRGLVAEILLIALKRYPKPVDRKDLPFWYWDYDYFRQATVHHVLMSFGRIELDYGENNEWETEVLKSFQLDDEHPLGLELLTGFEEFVIAKTKECFDKERL